MSSQEPTLWAVRKCCDFFGFNEADVEAVTGDRGAEQMRYLWETLGPQMYEEPFYLLRQEVWHAAEQQPDTLTEYFLQTVLPDEVVLDYGCGTGEVCRSRIGYGRVAFYDPSRLVRAYLAYKYAGIPDVEILGEDVHGFVAEGVDALVCTDVLEHVEQPLGLQQMLWDLLLPGGSMLVAFSLAFPHPGHLESAIRQFPKWRAWVFDHQIVGIGANYTVWLRK